MVALLSWINWLDRAEASLSGSSEAPPLVVGRLAEAPLRRRWRTLQGVTNAILDVDLGRQREVGVLALAQPPDPGGIDPNGDARGWMAPSDTVRHRLDAITPGAGALLDTGVQPGGWQVGIGVSALRLDAAVQARYWRSNIAAASLSTTPGYLDLGRAWIGPAWQPSRGNLAFGWSRVWEDGSKVSLNERSGLEVVDVAYQRRAMTFGFKSMTAADALQIDELQRIAGLRGQVLFIPFPGSPLPNAQPMIGRLVEVPPITQPSFVTFEVAFQIRQTL